MKRFTALLLAALLTLSFSLPALAADGYMEIIHNESDRVTTPLLYGVAEKFIVTIPSRVTMSEIEPVGVEIGAEEVYLPRAKSLNLYLSSYENYSEEDETWNLVLEGYPDFKISYDISIDETKIANRDAVLSCPGGTSTVSAELTFTATSSPTRSGNYMDTLTFTASIENN